MYIDTHCHMSRNDYSDIPFLIDKIRKSGVSKIIVNGVDISLNKVSKLMQGYTIGKEGFSVLLSSDGVIVYAPTEQIIMLNMKNLDVNKEAIVYVLLLLFSFPVYCQIRNIIRKLLYVPVYWYLLFLVQQV